MKTNIKHFVITRFLENNSVYDKAFNIFGNNQFASSWFELFKNNAFKSLINQTNKNFELLIVSSKKKYYAIL